MPLSTKVGVVPDDIVLDGTQFPLPKKGTALEFSAHVCCGQMAGLIKMPLGMEIGLGPGHTVLNGDPAPRRKRGHSPQFSARLSCRPSELLLSTC